jgi:subtilisin family serine protease
VISCSIIMPTWSDGDGGGATHAELTRLLTSSSKMFFACAGNTADRHWSGVFRDAGRGYHAWDNGIDNRLLPWGEGRVSVEMCAERAADLEVVLHDVSLGRDLQSCHLQHGSPCTAVVRFTPTQGHAYTIRVRSTTIGNQSRFHLFVLGGSLKQTHADSSIPFPGDGPEVITVGAVEGDLRRASYSSCGPNSPCPKPDLVALVPFESRFRARPFAGTSAATPQAAGLAAVLWCAHPSWRASQVRQALQEAAHDLGPRGHDWETGHGLVRLPALR